MVSLIKVNSVGFTGLLTTIPKLIAGLITLASTFGISGMAAAGFNGILEVLDINPVMFALSALVLVVTGAVALVDHFTTSLKEHQEQLANLKQEYSDISQKLETLSTQYSENTSKIEELNNLKKDGSITTVQDNELSSLKEINAQLALEIKLQETLKAAKAEEKTKEFTATTKAEFGSKKYSSGATHISESGILLENKDTTGFQQIDKDVESYKKATESKKAEIKTFLQSQLEDIDKTLTDQDYFNNATEQWQKDSNAAYDQLSEARAKIMLLLNNGDPDGTVFNSILNSEKFESANKALTDLGNNGELTASKLKELYKTNPAIKALIDLLVKLGLFDGKNFDSLANQFSSAASAADNTAASIDALSSSFDKLSTAKAGVEHLAKAHTELAKTGTVAFSTLADIQKAISGVVPDADKYIEALAGIKGNAAEAYKSLDKLTVKYVEGAIGANNLTDANKNYIVSMLNEIGVTNSDAVASSMISDQKVKQKLASIDLANATQQDIDALLQEAQQMGLTEQAVSDLSAAYATAQSAMVNAVNSGADARLGILKSELQGIKSLASAYAVLESKYTGTSGMTSSEISRHGTSSDMFGTSNDTSKILDYGKAQSEIQKIIDNFSTTPAVDYAGAVNNNNGNNNGSSAKEAEPYTATIDEFYKQKQKIEELENSLDGLKSKADLLSDDHTLAGQKQTVELLDQQVKLYKQEQAAMQDLNNSRRATIQNNVAALREEGFVVDYDANANKFLIENKEHLNALNAGTIEATNTLIKKYEDLIKTTEDLNSANVDQSKKWYDVASSIKEVQEKYNELFENEASYQKDRISLIKDSIDHEKSLLEDRKDIYDKHKTDVETLVSVIKDSIDEQKEALQGENDALDKQIDLQKKLQDLENAKNQKNKHIYREGQGFVWEADASTVSEKQADYDNTVRDNNLDAKIKALEEYEKKWQDVIDGYEKNQNKAKANKLLDQMLGYNWSSDDYWTLPESAIGDFTTYYSDQCDQLSEDVSGSVANQIKNLDELEKQWDESEYQIEQTANDYEGKLNDIKAFEKLSYDERLKYIQNFTDQAIEALNKLAEAQGKAVINAEESTHSDNVGDIDYSARIKAIENESSNYVDNDKSKGLVYDAVQELNSLESSRNKKIADNNLPYEQTSIYGGTVYPSDNKYGGGSNVGGSSSGASLDQMKQNGNAWHYATSDAERAALVEENQKIGSELGLTFNPSDGVWYDKNGSRAYSNGGVADFTGPAMLHGSSAAEMILNNADVGKVYDFIHDTSSISEAILGNLNMNGLKPLSSNSMLSQSQKPSITVGDIYVTGVQDVDGLAKAITTQLPAKMLQEIYKR